MFVESIILEQKTAPIAHSLLINSTHEKAKKKKVFVACLHFAFQ